MLWMIRPVPTIPLYIPNAASPDASHEVRAPGGYEWWQFEAEDARQDLQIIGSLQQGCAFHPRYLREFSSYLRAPTRRLPPLPDQFPCARFAVYRGGKLLHQFTTCHPPGSLAAETRRPQVAIGASRFTGGDELKVTFVGVPGIQSALRSRVLTEQRLEGEFSFIPRFAAPPHERIFLSPRLCGGAAHHWVVANPLCSVRGAIRCNGTTIDFNGLGYHDHQYGSAPIGPGVKRWLRGRVLFEDLVCAFHFVRAKDRSQPDQIHLLEAGEDGVHESRVDSFSADLSARSAWMLRYPQRIDFEDVLRLENPHLIDSTPFLLRLVYHAHHRGRSGRAVCEIVYPHRLRMPVLGKFIERSIEQRSMRSEPRA
jgi:carotenoid 1,2-hydratase